jgi:sigma-B regulation protein RsbU (phosphoserine phosphatase)
MRSAWPPVRRECQLTSPAYAAALGVLKRAVDTDLHDALLVALEPISGRDPTIYLVDFAHQTLIPVPTGNTNRSTPDEDIATTMAGRAFIDRSPVSAERDDGIRVWVPLLEGTMRTGVLAVTLPTVDEEILLGVEMLGVFAGMALAASAPLSDLSHLRRRGRAMSLAATMQWGLMPPLSAVTDRASIAGVLEPAYDIAGDGFDYAINRDVVEFGILDGMGHGVASSMLTGLAIGAYRHARREGSSLRQIHAAIERAVAEQYAGEAFATGVIGQLSISTGELDWSCAGHPPPLLLRNRKVIAELACEPNLPFGLGDDAPVNIGFQALEPGDAVLLFTDGVVEARTESGEEFGMERLVDLFEREAASERTGEELLRRVVRAVVDYQVDELRDDATMLLIAWSGASLDAERDVPGQRSPMSVG